MGRPMSGKTRVKTGERGGVQQQLMTNPNEFDLPEGEDDLEIQEISNDDNDFPDFEAHTQTQMYQNRRSSRGFQSTEQILKSRPTTATIFKKDTDLGLPFPEIFDRTERTIAATFAKFGDLSYYTPVQRIGSYNDFSGRLKRKHLIDIINYLHTTTKGIKPKEDPLASSSDYHDNSLFHGFMPEELPISHSHSNQQQIQQQINTQMLETENAPQVSVLESPFSPAAEAIEFDPAKICLPETKHYSHIWSQPLLNQMSLSINRYIHYQQSEEIKTDELSKYKKRWMTNALNLIGDDNLLREFEESVRSLYQEVFQNYAYAMRKSIIDYVLICPAERRRLHILMLPRPVPPSSYKIAYSGGYSVVKHRDWHLRKIAAEEEIKLRLLINNVVMSSYINWFYDFRWFKLINFKRLRNVKGNEGKCLSIDAFLNLAKSYRQKTVGVFQHIWHRGVMTILKKFKFLKKRGVGIGRWTFEGFQEQSRIEQNAEAMDDVFMNGISSYSEKNLPNSKELCELFESGEHFKKKKHGIPQPHFHYYSHGHLGTNTSSTKTITDCNEETYGFETFLENRLELISLEQLQDIRENPAYVAFVSLIGGYINFSEDGYKILAKEYKTELKYCTGNLMQIQLRRVVDRTIDMMEDFFLSFRPLEEIIAEIKKAEKQKKNTRNPSQYSGKRSAGGHSSKSSFQTSFSRGSVRMETSKGAESSSRGIVTQAEINQQQRTALLASRRLSEAIIIEGVDFESQLMHAEFMNYQHLVHPCFKVHLIIKNGELIFKEGLQKHQNSLNFI